MYYIGLYRVTNCQRCRIGTGYARKLMSQRRRPKRREKETKNKKILIMAIKPLADRVLIEPAAAEEKTIGGIIIPDTAKEKPLQGKVVATGNGTKDEEMVVKEGDTVLYGKYAGTELEYDGKKYLVMRQSDILAILG